MPIHSVVRGSKGLKKSLSRYHVVSRFVDRRKSSVMRSAEREVFRAMMGAFAAFQQAEILTF